MSGEYLNALAGGTQLHEYEIVRVLGAGGFGITYLAFDNNLEKPVAIKEYLPNELALRQDGDSVVAKSSGAKADFDKGLAQFMGEARIMAKFNHPNIVRVQRFFEANGTGYIVMDYAEGQTLSEVIKSQGPMDEATLKPILLAIADGLKRAHEAGILHRDIKPGNLIITDDGTPILIDFGAARAAIGAVSESVTSIVTPGYAPIEQYDSGGNQGPWSDIYGLGAVAYVALVGERPPDATSRIRSDPMTPAIDAAFSKATPHFLSAVDWALRPHEEDRPQNIDEWLGALRGERAPSPMSSGAHDDERTRKVLSPAQHTPSHGKQASAGSSGGGRSVLPYIVGVAILAGGLAVAWPMIQDVFLAPDQEQRDADAGTTTQQPAEDTSQSDQAGRNVDLEAEAWIRASTTDSTNAYNAYLDAFPDGAHASDARTRLAQIEAEQVRADEDAAWRRAEQANTIESYLAYLAAYPGGRYETEATNRLRGLSAHDGAAGFYATTTEVVVRQWPSTSAARVDSAAQNINMTVLGQVNGRDWYAVQRTDGSTGYIHNSLLTALDVGTSGEDQQQPVRGSRLSAAEQAEREEIRRRWLDAIRRRGG